MDLRYRRRAGDRGLVAQAALVRRAAGHLRRFLRRRDAMGAARRSAAGAAHLGDHRWSARCRPVHLPYGLHAPRGHAQLVQGDHPPGAAVRAVPHHTDLSTVRPAQRFHRCDASAHRCCGRHTQAPGAVVPGMALPPGPPRPVLGTPPSEPCTGDGAGADPAGQRLAGPATHPDHAPVRCAARARARRVAHRRTVDTPADRQRRGRRSRRREPRLAG